jgi:rubrerythrin
MRERIQQSTLSWWERVKREPGRLVDWLGKQYHGEVTAAERIERFVMVHVPEGDKRRTVLEVIAVQERTHAAWVAELLRARGIEPRVLNQRERYWEETLPHMDAFESAAAVAAKAEEMRLVRIEAIVADPETPEDIRRVFEKILPQERFHARAFSKMAGVEALAEAEAAHARGLVALGLINAAEVL